MGLGKSGCTVVGKYQWERNDMEILIYIIVYAIAIAVTTAVLAGSLFLVEDTQSSSFKELGVGMTLARCAGICLVTNLVMLLPLPPLLVLLLAFVVWFLGIMLLFQKTLGQTLILFLVNALFGCGVNGAIGYLLKHWLGADADI
jgi:hypothetical protein